MDESNIPIDINIGKLQDWLVSRRHVNKEWQQHILAVREKINNAIQDMPAHEGIAALLSGSYINYFHCLKIVDILKETEADTKNIFGRYGSQRMKDWQDILKNYEKENLYLAEAAQMLVRNINYEIPSLKKQIAKQEQLQTECEKKSADYLKNEASTKAEFHTSCKQLGIKGDNIKKELVLLLKELPGIYDEIGKSLSPILPAIELYSAFKKYMQGQSEPPALVKYVAERGNTTVYEWTYGEPPLSVQPDPAHADEVEVDTTNEIDFGSTEPAEIDFDIAAQGDIDFGDAGEIDFGDNAGSEIDWGGLGEGDNTATDQDLSSAIAEVSLEESGIVVESGGVAGGVARGREALTVLDNPSTRAQFIEQIVELESFLKMRLYETSSQDGYGFSLVQELPTHTTDSLTAMLDAVQVSLAHITSLKLTHLHNVRHSPRYVDVLAAQLQQKLSLCEKLVSVSERAREQACEASARESELRPLLTRIIERSRELQTELERDISKKYKGRPVNIIGGVKFL